MMKDDMRPSYWESKPKLRNLYLLLGFGMGKIGQKSKRAPVRSIPPNSVGNCTWFMIPGTKSCFSLAWVLHLSPGNGQEMDGSNCTEARRTRSSPKKGRGIHRLPTQSLILRNISV